MIDNERDRPELLPRARQEIARAAQLDIGRLYTESVLADATNLLADLYSAGLYHGIDSAGWDLDPRSTRLAGCALEAHRLYLRENPKIPTTTEGVDALGHQLIDALPTHAAFYDPELHAAVLARTPATPPWGTDGQARLAVTVLLDGPATTWAITLDRPQSPALDVAAEISDAGVTDVATLATQVNRGTHGNPFPY